MDQLAGRNALTKGQADYLDSLSTLIEVFETEQHAIDTSDITPIDALKYLMNANDMNPSDLGTLLGYRTLGYKILNGQRELSKAHIRTLADRFKVSPGLFL